jgi:TonB family protein
MVTKKILIVDYDQNSLASLQGTLAGLGYQVLTAADGQAGWDKYNKECPDLVLMEAMLPKVHGFELCQRITCERNSQATVFIMTGVYKDRVYRTEALRTYGASEYFEKPLKMAELLASVEAVLGKPAPKPEEPLRAAETAAPPAPEMRAEAPTAPARKREKGRSDDALFTLPDDLDRLVREIPKIHKPDRRDAPAEPKPEAVADELLKSVLVEAAPPRTVTPQPGGGNGNGNGRADIDKVLATALADLDLKKEKIKVPKTAPLPPPPPKVEPLPEPTPPPVKQAPAPAPPPPVEVRKPKPVNPAPPVPPPPTPPPAIDRPVQADMKSTLLVGDPGSDISPFFTPEKAKPAAPVEKPKFHQPPPPATRPVPPPPAPKPAPRPVEKTAKPAAPIAAPVKPVSAPPKPEPVPPARAALDITKKKIQPTIGGDIFQDFHETPEEKPKGFPKAVAVGIGVAVIAAAGYLFLRPKRDAAPLPAVQERARPQEVAQSNLPPAEPESKPAELESKPAVKPPATEVKTAPQANKKKTQAKPTPAETEPVGAPAILPNLAAGAPEPPPGGPGGLDGNDGNGSPLSSQPQADAPRAKTAEQPQGANAEIAAKMPIEPPVHEGDLVALSAVTEPPKLIKTVDPIYPPAAQRLGVSGTITVNALIDEKGDVIETGILRGIQDDKGLGRAAENAVRKWKFEPARKNGVAVKVWKPFVIAFKADENPADRMK